MPSTQEKSNENIGNLEANLPQYDIDINITNFGEERSNKKDEFDQSVAVNRSVYQPNKKEYSINNDDFEIEHNNIEDINSQSK